MDARLSSAFLVPGEMRRRRLKVRRSQHPRMRRHWSKRPLAHLCVGPQERIDELCAILVNYKRFRRILAN
jgi:hypothetical protein